MRAVTDECHEDKEEIPLDESEGESLEIEEIDEESPDFASTPHS